MCNKIKKGYNNLFCFIGIRDCPWNKIQLLCNVCSATFCSFITNAQIQQQPSPVKYFTLSHTCKQPYREECPSWQTSRCAGLHSPSTSESHSWAHSCCSWSEKSCPLAQHRWSSTITRRHINTFNARAKITPGPEGVGLVVVAVLVVVVAAVAVVVVVSGECRLAWCTGKALGPINQAVVHQARLVVGWVTVCSSSSRPLCQYYKMQQYSNGSSHGSSSCWWLATSGME